MPPSNRGRTMAEVGAEVDASMRTILLSSDRRQITHAFERLTCIVKGDCVCDDCPEWDKDVYWVYEISRRLVPSRAMQLIKERHVPSARWSGYVKALYRELFMALYDDLWPDTAVYSNGQMEDVAVQRSPFLPAPLVASTLALIKRELSKKAPAKRPGKKAPAKKPQTVSS
jgi:hypothetical protein